MGARPSLLRRDGPVTGVHVLPLGDLVEHDANCDCICGPDVEYIDPDTGITYPGGPVVTHHSLDGREQNEEPRLRQTPIQGGAAAEGNDAGRGSS